MSLLLMGVGNAVESSPPAVPAGVSAASSVTTITISWTPSAGATSYNIYRGTSSGGETLYMTGQSEPFVDTPTPQVEYFYEVTAVGPGGESAKSAEVNGLATGNPLQIFGQSNLPFWGRADLGLSTNGAMLCATASSQYASLASPLFTTAPLTVSVNVNPTNLSQSSGLWAVTTSAAGNYQCFCEITSAGKIGVSFSGSSTSITSATVLSAGTGYNVLVTYNGTTCNIYINGVKDTNSGPLTNIFGTLANSYIGCISSTPFFPASATIGPFQVWSRVLGSAEIATVSAGVLYRQFTSALQTGNVASIEFTVPGNLGKDNSPNNNTFTPVNAPTYVAGPVTYSPPAGSYLLDGEACSAIADQSGNGNNATQPIGANRGIFTLNVINGLPGIKGDGTGAYYQLSGGALAMLQNVAGSTLGGVWSYQNVATKPEVPIFISNGTSTGNTRAALQTSNVGGTLAPAGFYATQGRTADADAGVSAFSSIASQDGFVLQTGQINNAGGTMTVRINGTQVGTGNLASSGNTSNTPSEVIWLMGVDDSSFMLGYLCEAIIASETASAAQIAQLENYLSRWGV